MIEYQEYELLELFESEPIVINKDACIYTYKHTDKFEFRLELYFSAYDQCYSISLWYKNFANSLFDIGFNNVKKIVCQKDKLIIEQENKEKDAVVYFTPTYTFTFEERLKN
jgi:hypothetical protein